jgi:hypothetical protein
LDKHFRLLREDALHTIKDHIETQTRSWRNARIIDFAFTGFGTKKALTFQVRIDPLPDGNPNWEISRALMYGSIVTFCTNGQPKLIGKISHRNCEAEDDWLNHPRGPIVSVSFEPNTKDFQQALHDVRMFRNRPSYDLVETSSSFFTYQPVLLSLQSKYSLPFLEELCNLAVPKSPRAPTYLPGIIMMPCDSSFKRYQCSLSS